MTKDKKPLIIVLSGAQGVGKKTLAHQLSIDLRIKQRLTLSCMTKVMKMFLPNNHMIKTWNTFKKHDTKYVRIKLKNESRFVGKIITNFVNLSECSGENCVIDGAQLLPEFLPLGKILFFYISIPNNEHKKRFNNPTITRLKHITNTSFDLTKKINKIILEECQGYPIYKITNIGTPQKISKQIIKIIKKNHPDYRDKFIWCGK